jgi:hypothetical protein
MLFFRFEKDGLVVAAGIWRSRPRFSLMVTAYSFSLCPFLEGIMENIDSQRLDA